ncbi:MAG: SgcJ/EcaC family oxidoreductase [Rhizomicrobium sp.]
MPAFTNVFGIELQGREAIAHGHAQILAGMFRDSTLRLDAPSVLPLGPGLAWVAARWRMDGAYDPQGAPWPNRRGIMHFVAADDGGTWRIAAFTNMDLPPDEQVAASREQLAHGSQP